MKTTKGQKIKHLREKNNMTQEELASAVGGSTMNISAIETGIRNPSRKRLFKIAETFGVGIEYFDDEETIVSQTIPDISMFSSIIDDLRNQVSFLQEENSRLMGLLELALNGKSNFPEGSGNDGRIIKMYPVSDTQTEAAKAA